MYLYTVYACMNTRSYHIINIHDYLCSQTKMALSVHVRYFVSVYQYVYLVTKAKYIIGTDM